MIRHGRLHALCSPLHVVHFGGTLCPALDGQFRASAPAQTSSLLSSTCTESQSSHILGTYTLLEETCRTVGCGGCRHGILRKVCMLLYCFSIIASSYLGHCAARLVTQFRFTTALCLRQDTTSGLVCIGKFGLARSRPLKKILLISLRLVKSSLVVNAIFTVVFSRPLYCSIFVLGNPVILEHICSLFVKCAHI
jgi:hypothetical protein